MLNKNFEYQFNEWKIDPITLGFTHNVKGKIRVQNKVAEVLIVLLEANGELVTKEDLYKKVWNNILVSENSLNKAVSELRKILNDSRSNPQFIETIPKKGYRFIVPLKKIERPYLTNSIVERKNYLLGFGLIVFTFLIFSFIYFKITSKEDRKLSVISHDGEKIAFYKRDSLQYGIYIHDLNSNKEEKIISHSKPESFVLGWSPLNNQIVYNATQKINTFYAINIIDIKTKKITYIKFAKNPHKHKTESLPNGHSEPIYFVENKELRGNGESIEHIYLNENDTIKVLFINKLIQNFSW